jgi:hypothetical protein
MYSGSATVAARLLARIGILMTLGIVTVTPDRGWQEKVVGSGFRFSYYCGINCTGTGGWLAQCRNPGSNVYAVESKSARGRG